MDSANLVLRLRRRLAFSVHVAFVLVLVFLLTRGDHEERIYDRLVERVRQQTSTNVETAVALNSVVHDLMIDRTNIWGEPIGGVYDHVFRSISQELNAPSSACGSFCAVLIKAIQNAGMNARYVQMTNRDGDLGVHIMVEAEVAPGQWALLCPLYDLTFRRPDGGLADYRDVQQNLGYYRAQLPAEWSPRYDFADVRYTNWEKIPVIMPALRTVLSWFLSPEELRTFCLRAYMTNIFFFYSFVLCTAYALYLLASILWSRHRRRPRGDLIAVEPVRPVPAPAQPARTRTSRATEGSDPCHGTGIGVRPMLG